MPPSSGPGRYRALVAMMSRKWSGFIRCSRSRMPPLSSWKMPLVSPRQSRANVSASSSGNLYGSIRSPRRLLDQLDGLGEDRQVAQAEEVHLQQAGRFDVAHRPLGDDFRLALHALQRHVLVERPVGDHHRRGVRADVAGQAFDLHGQVEQLADFGVGVVGLASGRRSASSASSSVMPSSSGTIATI